MKGPEAPARAILALLVFASASAAAQHEGNRNAAATLARTGEVSCEPSLPVFCANIHVSCSGRSSIPTFPFKLRASGTRGWIESDADTAGIAQQYENGRLEWDADAASVILRPHQSPGYIKLLADGSYSLRLYSSHAATMSLGRCR